MSALTMTTETTSRYVEPTELAALIASPVWAALSGDHRQAVRAMQCRASNDDAVNGELPLDTILMVKFRVPRARLGNIIGDLIALRVFVKTSKQDGYGVFRMSWLPTADAPEGNDFLTANIEAWRVDTNKLPHGTNYGRNAELMTAIRDAMEHAAHLSAADLSLLDGVKWLLRNGTAPSEKQGWAIKAIANRINREIDAKAKPGSMRSDVPSPAKPASTPRTVPLPSVKHSTGRRAPRDRAPATPTPADHDEKSAFHVSKPAAKPAMPKAVEVPKVTPFDAGTNVISDVWGKGIVIMSDPERSVVRFHGNKHGMGESPAVRVLTATLRPSVAA